MIVLKKWSLIIQISLLILFAALLTFNGFETFDLRAQDLLYQQKTPIETDILIIGIDDESLRNLGRWPWPRDYHGEVLRLVGAGEPAAIGYDVIFAEASQKAEEDDYLLQIVAGLDNVVFPSYGSFAQKAERGILNAIDLIKPFEDLNLISKTGHINTLMDNDGIVRKTILNFAYQGEEINSFSWMLYKIYEARLGKRPLDIAEIPTDPWQRTFIRYSGRPGEMEILSFFDVLNGDIPGEYFRDKIILIGPTATGLADDYFFTPLAPQVPMYGVEIHGNIIQQFLKLSFWREIPLLMQGILLIVLGIIGNVTFARLMPGAGVAVLAGLIGLLLIFLKVLSAGKNGYVMSFIYPVGFLMLQYVVILGEKFILEMLEKKRVTDVFGKYVAPQIVDEILEAGGIGLKLGGVRRDITVLFVDIRGFTPLSEAIEPEDVVSILNEYLTLCAEAIFAFGGTLDKYIGDATMALFNAPLDLEKHQLKAVQTAWAMHERAKPLQNKLKKEFGRTIRFGIGIHTGSAIVGNIGANFRMDYTAIGDTVNTAARLESSSKPGQILISQAVYDYVRDYVEVTDLGVIQVKGKSEVLQVYQIDRILEI